MANKGPIILGIGAAIAALGLILRKGKPSEAIPEEEVPEEEVPEAPTIPEPIPTPIPTPIPEPIPVPEPKPEPEPELPANAVSVFLKNPPTDATMWQLGLTDKNVTVPIRPVNDKDRYAIDEAIIFEVPGGLEFPLLITGMQLMKWKNGIEGGTLQVVYYMQSFRPYASFTTGMTGEEVVLHYGGAVALSEDGGPYPAAGESAEDYYARVEDWAVNGLPEPSYRNITIPDYGTFYFEPK